MTIHRSTGEWSVVARQQAAVARIGQLGLQGGDLSGLLDEALAVVGQTLELPYVTLLELDADWRSFSVQGAAVDGATVERSIFAGTRVPAGRDSLPGFTVMQGGAVCSSDLVNDQRFRSRAAEYDTPAAAAVTAPVGWGERPWGVLGAYSAGPRDWSEDDINFVQSMANTIGLAISRQRAEDALRESSARLELSMEAGGLGAWSWEFGPDLIDFTPTAAALYGVEPGIRSLTSEQYLDLVHAEDRTAIRGSSYEAMQTTGQIHVVFRWFNQRLREYRWMESWGSLAGELPQRPHRLIGVTADITDRRRADELRESLLAAEQQARLEGEQARERLSMLVDGAALFNSMLDSSEILASLPQFCVPRFADVCLVDVLQDDGSLAEVAAHAIDGDTLTDVRELRRIRADLDGEGGVYSERAVAITGQSAFVPSYSDDMFVAAARDEDHLAVFRRFGACSSIVVALTARGRVLGVLSVLNTRSGRHFTSDDLASVQDLADRVALAVDNSRLFESRNRVTRSLQAALLPPALPEIEGLELAAGYQVAEDDIAVGGDFYDVIEMGDRAWGLVVGDVCGRGPEAAALTGLMRHSVRAAVVRERLPSGVLAQTNDAVLGQISENRFCTAAYLRIECRPDRPVRVVASSAGHPSPMVLRRDGTAELVNCAGMLLGVVPSPRLIDVEVELEPGDAIVLYTDGVTEARNGADLFGEERLLEALATLSGHGAEGIVSGLADAVRNFADDASDDQAIVVVRVPEA